jgi:hypothetical protein
MEGGLGYAPMTTGVWGWNPQQRTKMDAMLRIPTKYGLCKVTTTLSV